MTEQDKKNLENELDGLNELVKNNSITVKEACRTIMAKAASIKEMAAFEVTGERGMKGYTHFCEAVQGSTQEAMHKFLFQSSYDPSTTICTLYDQGMDKAAIIKYVIENDKKGTLAGKETLLSDAFEFIIQARQYDNEHLEDSRRLAYETIKNDRVAPPDVEKFTAKLDECGIESVKEPAAGNDFGVHEIIAEKAVTVIRDHYKIPRWARCLMNRPGITEEEKKNIETTWNRDDEGKKAVFEMFFSAIEHVDPAYLDVNNLQDYVRNFKTNDYLGGLAFDSDMALADYTKLGFTMPEKRRADMDVVRRCMSDIQNRFNKELIVMDHPRYKYIKNAGKITQEQAGMLIAASAAEKVDTENQKQVQDRTDSIFFANELYTFAGNKLPDPTRAKGILAFNRQYEGDEKTRHLNEWYENFKKTLAADGIDLDDPVAMARIQAQVPAREVGGGIVRDYSGSTMYMPAAKGMDENHFLKDKPPYADTKWYAANMNSARNLTPEQIENLYNLSREGKLAIYGRDMSEDSLRVIYNDHNGMPQVSRPLVDVDSDAVYGDVKACAEEMFPDTGYPENIYQGACSVHKAARNEIPMLAAEDLTYDMDYEEAVRVNYTRTLLRDYFENTDKYRNESYADDRAAQIYVVSKYNFSPDDDFKAEYEKYIEENDITFESDNIVPTDQEKAIKSINNPRLTDLKMPEITEEMISFVGSLDSVLKENGWDMDIYSNRASLRIFTDKSGYIREIPACAPLRFPKTKEGFFFDASYIVSKQADESPEDFAARYLAQNTSGIRINPDTIRSKGTTDSELLRIALIYESAKKGQLLINRPGEPASSAVPIIPGEDGKAKVVTDFAELGVEERKKDYYVNAARIRRTYKDPEEAAKKNYLEKYAKLIDVSSYETSASSMVAVAADALNQAKRKGINTKAVFIDQTMAIAPKTNVDFASYIDICKEELELEIDFKPRKFSAKQMAGRKALSESARRSFLDTMYEKERQSIYADEAVNRKLVTREEADGLVGYRGLLTVFLDRSSSPDAMKNNVEAIRILAKGTNEEKTDLYNKCLAKFANFDSAEFFNISDEDLVRRWPEIDENMYRLQELIRINGDLEKKGIHADGQLLEKAMKAERYSGDIYLYMANRIQAIANPAYEGTDIDQLLSLESSDLNSMTSIDAEKSGRAYKILAGNLQSAKMGVQLAAASYIENQLADKYGADVNTGEFYDLNGDKLDKFAVYDELLKGNVVFAAGRGKDDVHAFKAEKGRFKADAQPDSKYARKINALSSERREARIEKENKAREAAERKAKEEVDRELNALSQDLEKGQAEEERLTDLRNERADRKSVKNEVDGEDLNNLFDQKPGEEKKAEVQQKPAGEPEPGKAAEGSKLAEPKQEEVVKEEKPQAAAPRSELDIQREKTAAYLKEEISYQQFKLGLIIDSYAPGKPFGNKPEDYSSNVRACMTEMLAAIRALEQSEKKDISKEELEKLGSKDGLKAVKASMKNEKALQMTLDSLKPTGTIETAQIEKFALRADDITKTGIAEQADHSPELDKLYESKIKEIRNFYSTRYNANLTADKLEKQIKEEQKQAEMKQMARDAMNKGIGKYEGFSNAMDKFIGDSREALFDCMRNYNLEYENSRDIARQSLAVLFAAVTVKDIIDSKYMTYEQTRALCSDKGLKDSAQEILKDPGFDEFFKTVRGNAQNICEACSKGPEAYREKLKSMLDDYKVKHIEVQKQAKVKKEEKPVVVNGNKSKVKGLQ